MRENFLRSWNSEQLWSVARSQSTFWLFRVPEQCEAAIQGCFVVHGKLGVLRETFLFVYLLEKDHPQLSSKIQRFWHHLLETWHYRKYNVPEREMGREPKNASMLVPRFQRGGGILNHIGGTYSHGGMVDYTRFPFSEIHLENFQTLWNFRAGKSTSKLKCVLKQQILISQCNGWKKLREQSQSTNLWHRVRLCGEQISPTTICLMRWLRLHWKSCSTRMCTSEKSKCGRATRSKIRPILTRETNF